MANYFQSPVYTFIFVVVTQEYETNAEREYVIIGNAALIKCDIPSFVADFVSVESWSDNENNEYFSGISNNYGNLILYIKMNII